MQTWLPFEYREFYDVPRLLAVEYRGQVYVFDSPFDPAADEYSHHYTVYSLPRHSKAHLASETWDDALSSAATVGRVPVGAVEFDDTRRRSMSDSIFASLDLG